MGLLGAALAIGLLLAPIAPAEHGESTIERAGGGLDGAVITLDPGHNGANGANPEEINQQVPIGNGETKECDTTGTATASGYTESAYTLSVARRLRRLLERAGAKVVMTRRDDNGVGPASTSARGSATAPGPTLRFRSTPTAGRPRAAASTSSGRPGPGG